jgi:hypothetical protein
MSRTQNRAANIDPDMRLLSGAELDVVMGGVSAGYGSLGTRVNVSPFSIMPVSDPPGNSSAGPAICRSDQTSPNPQAPYPKGPLNTKKAPSAMRAKPTA